MTVLVQNGTLHQGDIIIAGTAVGRVRTMINDKGQRVTEAGPSIPVEIAGMSEVPGAGDTFNAVADERMARELVEERKQQEKEKTLGVAKKVTLDDLFARIQQGEIKDFNIIVKADVQGSAEAVKTSLEKLSNEEVRVRVIHSGVGAISESDVMLAASYGAIIVGFNVRPDNAARDYAARANVEMRMYRVIYDCINEIEAAMKGMLAPKFEEQVIAHVEITPALQGQQGRHGLRLLRAGRQGPARLQGPRRARRHSHVRGRDGLPAPLQGRREGSRRRLRVRHPDREVQRRARGRHHRSLRHEADRELTVLTGTECLGRFVPGRLIYHRYWALK